MDCCSLLTVLTKNSAGSKKYSWTIGQHKKPSHQKERQIIFKNYAKNDKCFYALND
jgi:hypothetical protein